MRSRLIPICSLIVIASHAMAGVAMEDGRDGRALRFEILRGLETQALELTPAESGYRCLDGTLGVRVERSTKGKLTGWEIEMINDSGEALRLQPQLVWTVPGLGAYDRYWDGSQTLTQIGEITEARKFSTLRSMAPWSGLVGAKRALVLGTAPSQILSFVESGFIPPGDGRPAELSFAARLIIPPHARRTISFFSGDLDAPFGGERELVQRVHEAYPQSFQPDPHAPPSLWGASAHYWMATKSPDTLPGRAPIEFMRRMNVSWEWCYSPFKRSGDIWGEEEYWDYTPLVPFDKKPTLRLGQKIDFGEISRSEFLDRREKYFNQYNGAFGFMFYTPFAAWMEHQLAREKFSDAIIDDATQMTDLKYFVTGYDRELLVLPWFTSYQKLVETQYRRVAETYDIHGFGFDVALGGARYRGPAVANADAPRAYDEKGDFIDVGAAAAYVLDYVKSLPTRFDKSQRLAAVINGTRSFNSAVRGDYGMLEGTPYFHGREQIPLSRYLFGQKPASWWKGWSYTQFAVPNWQRYDRQHFLKTMRGLVDYTIFSSFQWGNIPTLNYEMGVPKVTGTVPILIDSLRRGWQAVFPVDFSWEGSVHTGRYGRDLQTRLFWGNPYEEPRRIDATVDGSYLGDGTYVFAARLNGPARLENRLDHGKTSFAVGVPSRQPFLVDAVAALPGDAEGVVAGSLETSPYRIRINLDISANGDRPAVLRLPKHEGYDAPVVSNDGRTLTVVAREGGYELTLPAGAREVRIAAEYASSLLRFTPEQLAAFPFFATEFDPGFAVYSPSLKQLSPYVIDERLRQFVSFYPIASGKNSTPQPLRFTEEQSVTGPVLAITLDPAASGATISFASPERIEITAPNSEELSATLDRFLALLNERYPYHPGFIATWGMDAGLLRHVKAGGENLEDAP